MTRFTRLDSPIGTLTLASDGASLTGLQMSPATIGPDWKRDDRAPILLEARKQLREYFSGARTRFDLPLAPKGTPFQLKVWEALREIPYSETRSYADIARYVGCPKGYRAVGLANGANPIAIVVPCHRVIGADGSLTGFGGGLPRKRALLKLERGAPLASSPLHC
ncbi:MAG: O-6-methylguanine DNA [Planctomycetota bacterium]|nr:MAG: O-6-methylguanine DNA [Planctomycetota bacterium]